MTELIKDLCALHVLSRSSPSCRNEAGEAGREIWARRMMRSRLTLSKHGLSGHLKEISGNLGIKKNQYPSAGCYVKLGRLKVTSSSIFRYPWDSGGESWGLGSNLGSCRIILARNGLD